MVPEGSYSSSFLSEEPLDRSYDFISTCGQNSFSIRFGGEEEKLSARGFSPLNSNFFLISPAVLPPPRPSASFLPHLCRHSSTMARCVVAATRPAQRAIPASHSAASAAVGQTWLVATAPCVPQATGDSPTANVSLIILYSLSLLLM